MIINSVFARSVCDEAIPEIAASAERTRNDEIS